MSNDILCKMCLSYPIIYIIESYFFDLVQQNKKIKKRISQILKDIPGNPMKNNLFFVGLH